jgi:hypothetical protein
MTNGLLSPGDLVRVIHYETFGYNTLGVATPIKVNTIMMIIASNFPNRQLHYGVLAILSKESSMIVVEVERFNLKCII